MPACLHFGVRTDRLERGFAQCRRHRFRQRRAVQRESTAMTQVRRRFLWRSMLFESLSTRHTEAAVTSLDQDSGVLQHSNAPRVTLCTKGINLLPQPCARSRHEPAAGDPAGTNRPYSAEAPPRPPMLHALLAHLRRLYQAAALAAFVGSSSLVLASADGRTHGGDCPRALRRGSRRRRA